MKKKAAFQSFGSRNSSPDLLHVGPHSPECILLRASIIRGWELTEILRGKERECEQAAAESPAERASALTATH